MDSRQGSGDNPVADFSSAPAAQYLRQFIQGRAGGHDVIDDRNMFAGHIYFTTKSPADIFLPLFPR